MFLVSINVFPTLHLIIHLIKPPLPLPIREFLAFLVKGILGLKGSHPLFLKYSLVNFFLNVKFFFKNFKINL